MALGLRLVAILTHDLLKCDGLHTHSLRRKGEGLVVKGEEQRYTLGYLSQHVNITHDDLIQMSISHQLRGFHHAVLKTSPHSLGERRERGEREERGRREGGEREGGGRREGGEREGGGRREGGRREERGRREGGRREERGRREGGRREERERREGEWREKRGRGSYSDDDKGHSALTFV